MGKQFRMHDVAAAREAFLMALVTPDDMVRAVAYGKNPTQLSETVAPRLGVTGRTVLRWAEKMRAEGHRCLCEECACPTMIRAPRPLCRYCQRHGEPSCGFYGGELDEYLSVESLFTGLSTD